VCAPQPLRQNLQPGVLDSESLQLFHRREHIVAARPRATVSLPGMMQLLGEAQLTGILAMTAINHVAECMHALLRVIVNPDPAPGFAIDAGDLLAASQVFDGLRAQM